MGSSHQASHQRKKPPWKPKTTKPKPSTSIAVNITAGLLHVNVHVDEQNSHIGTTETNSALDITMLTAQLEDILQSIAQANEFSQAQAGMQNVQENLKSTQKPKNDLSPLTEADIPRLHEQWLNEYADILGGVPEALPPLREINHTIPLIDPSKKYNYYLPHCPDSLQQQLKEKIEQYTCAGWWQAEPWRQPRDYHDIQKFLGIVNYIAAYLPELASFTSPLSDMSKNKQPIMWRPIHDACMQNIKDLCCEGNIPVLRLINLKLDESIWAICNASVSGVGAMYGQGSIWQKCRPAGFMSKKFTDAQRNYRVFEAETFAILEALLKWEDKLIGYRIHMVTDHESLQFFNTQKRLSGRQMHWMEYLSCFDFDITYIKGSDRPGEIHDLHKYVSADARLDEDGEDLPLGCKAELSHMLEQAYFLRHSSRLKEKQEKHDIEAAELEANKPDNHIHSDDSNKTEPPSHYFDPTVIDSLASGPDL
uniref:Reverse transcriptase RNase H-like domain-containing protein n=1 Tax=Moniliophthora roreri TaxID=221103 RepID=A0A0W0FW83_MONRR